MDNDEQAAESRPRPPMADEEDAPVTRRSNRTRGRTRLDMGEDLRAQQIEDQPVRRRLYDPDPQTETTDGT